MTRTISYKKWRCSNGHEWEALSSEEVRLTVHSDPSITVSGCMRCLMDLLRDKLGTVEVTDG